MPEETFEGFLDWLEANDLWDRLQTQLAYLAPDDEPLRDAAQILDHQRSELVAQIEAQAMNAAGERLHELLSALLELRDRLKAQLADPSFRIDAVSKLPAPRQTLQSAWTALVNAVEGIGAANVAVPVAGLGRAAQLGPRRARLNKIRCELGVAMAGIDTLTSLCRYAPPGGMEASQTLHRAHGVAIAGKQFVDLCKAAIVARRARDVGAALQDLAAALDAAGWNAESSAEARRLAAAYVSAFGARSLLMEMWNASANLAEFEFQDVDPVDGVLGTFSALKLPPGRSERILCWLMAHAPAEGPPDGRSVVLAQLATWCTWLRYARAARDEASARRLARVVDVVLTKKQHRAADWQTTLDLPSAADLRDLHGIMDAFRKNPAAKPQVASRMDRVGAPVLARLAAVSATLREARPAVWPVALASKIAWFYVDGMSGHAEPQRVRRQELGPLVVGRIAGIVRIVNTSLRETDSVLDQLARSIFRDAPDDERFCSVGTYGRCDRWLYGEAVEAAVIEACGSDEAAAAEAVFLFCQPVVVTDDRSTRLLQVLKHLAVHCAAFANGLWAPMRVTDPALRDLHLHHYFGAAAAP